MLQRHMQPSSTAARVPGSLNGPGYAGMSSKQLIPARVLVGLVLFVVAAAVDAQSVVIGSGVPVVENFNALATTGTANVAVPTGWYFVENDVAGQYSAGDGSGATLSGGVWSFGSAAATERAFGSVRSGSTVPKIGAQLQNGTGAVLPEILISYRGEQWRIGLGNRVPPDRLDFQYSLNATSLSTGTWVDVDALDFVTPNPTGALGGYDGNLLVNRTAISAVISGLSIAPNATLWVRWLDPDAAGADDGLAIDDASFGVAVDVPPVVTATVPTIGEPGFPIDGNLVVTFSEPVATAAGAFTLACPPTPPHTVTVTGSGNTRTINPDTNFAYGDVCTAQVVAANVTDLDGTPDAMQSNYTWTINVVADTAPTIASTVPASSATGIAVNAVVVINFSEPVNTTIPWITLTCNSVVFNGTLAASNGGATWTLDPFTNFNNSDVCSVQITGANVVDVDGTPNALAGNPAYSFTVAADVVPTISSTYPVHLDVNVPAASNLTIVFSEPVTVQSGAFSINCVGSGAHSFVQSDNAQTQYTLNPDIEFTAGESCTFDVTAALITDIDGVANALASNARIDFTVGAGVAGYYERVDQSSCRALRATLHGVIDDHSAVVYSDSDNTWTPGVPGSYDVWEVLNLADEDPLDVSKILDVYRNESYTKLSGGVGVYNREHVWPNSQGFNNLSMLEGFPNSPYTDTHMLMASNTDYNARRGSRVYATCNPAITATCTVDATIANPSNGSGGGPAGYTMPPGHNWYTNGQDGNSGSYEPWSFRRGDLARAMLYMDVRYEGGRNSRNLQSEPQLILTDNRSLIIITSSYAAPAYSGLLAPLLDWHANDSVTAREGLRNALVEGVQGNRNPFVDHPEWASVLFAGTCMGPAFVAVDDDFFGTEDSVLSRNGANDIGVLNDDHVFEGNALLVNTVPAVQPLHGTVALSSNGQFVYTAVANYCGKDSFVYSVSNGNLIDTAVANIDLVCVNDLPVMIGSIGNVSVNAGNPVNIATEQAFDDADDDVLVYSVSASPALPASLSINTASGVITGTPLIADASVYTVTVRATEPSPLSGFATQTFTLTISNDPGALFRNGFE